MKLNFNAPLIGLDGPLENVTLRTVALQALLADFESERTVPGEEKFRRWNLAKRIQAPGPIEIAAEEVALVKRLLALGYGPAVLGPAYEALESAGEPLPDNVRPIGA